MSKGYNGFKEKVKEMGLSFSGVPQREITYWDTKLNVFQKQVFLKAAGYPNTNPLTPWAHLTPIQRQEIKHKIRNQVQAHAAFLGVSLQALPV